MRSLGFDSHLFRHMHALANDIGERRGRPHRDRKAAPGTTPARTMKLVAFVNEEPPFKAHSDFPVEFLASLSFVPGIARSDQLSFWREGYPAVMVTDTAFYRYPYYHTGWDTPEKVSYPDMARVVEGLAKTLAALAG